MHQETGGVFAAGDNVASYPGSNGTGKSTRTPAAAQADTYRAAAGFCPRAGDRNIKAAVAAAATDGLRHKTVGLRAQMGMVDVRITSRAASNEAAAELNESFVSAVRMRLGEADIYGYDDDALEDAVARLLTDLTDVTVLTNSLHVAKRFAAAGPRLIMTGGEFRRLSQTFVGSMTHPLIDKLHVDKAFMGTIGLTAEAGMTTTDPREAHTKERVMTHASQVILLADSSKIGKVSFARFGDLDRVDVLITNRGAPEGELKELRNRGIKVIEA